MKHFVLIVIFLLVGCTLSDTPFYKAYELEGVTKVADLSNNLYLYERNVDSNTHYKRYYYVGNVDGKVFRELVTYFAFGNSEGFIINDYDFNFISAYETNNNGCVDVGIEVEVLNSDGEQVFHKLEEEEKIYISYCLEDGKPYNSNN